MYIDALLKSEFMESLGRIPMDPHTFKTGSRGYYGTAKIEIDGKRYQAVCMLVEIGSKPAEQEGNKPAEQEGGKP